MLPKTQQILFFSQLQVYKYERSYDRAHYSLKTKIRQKGTVLDEDLAKVGGEVEVSQVAEGNYGGRLVANLGKQ